MGTTSAARSQATASSASAPPCVDGETSSTQSPGFQFDPFVDGTGTCGGANPSRVELALGSLGAEFKAALVRNIEAGAPTPGKSTEIGVSVRCPLDGALFLAGNLTINASRAASGIVTASLAGSLGPSVGNGVALFADLLAGASIQGEGTSAARTVDMLALALENAIRAVGDDTLAQKIAADRWNVKNAALLPLLSTCMFTGRQLGDVIADIVWGKGHLEAMKATMKDGEAAQLGATATIGGEAGFAPEPNQEGMTGKVEGAFGVAGQQRIEKAEGAPVATTTSKSFTAHVGFESDFVNGAFDLQVPTQPGVIGGSLTFTGSAHGNPALLGDMTKYLTFLVGAMDAATTALGTVPPEAKDAAAAAVSTMTMSEAAVRSAVATAEHAVMLELHNLGAETQAGVEVSLAFDLATRKATLQFSYTIDNGVELGALASASIGQKTLIGKPITFPVTK